MRIYEASAAVASTEIEIKADLEVVWRILSSIDRWPEWNADVISAKLHGELAPGSIFVWNAGHISITSTISDVKRPHLLAWTGSSLGIRAVHTWQMEKRGERVLVRTEESWEGLFPHILRWPIKKMLQSSIESWLQQLKAEAEKSADI